MDKNKTINERIKYLRKQNDLTQLQLAEKLNITDKAVSKWESGDGNPDISLLSKLAEIFNVTTDYLLTGKINESISIEDMDSEKRLFLLIKNDDANLFLKFGYLKHDILFNSSFYCKDDYLTLDLKIIESIYNNHSIKIFSALLNEAVKYKNGSDNHQHNVICDKAMLLKGDLDKYVKMCCDCKRLDGLELINLKYFAIGDKTELTKKYIHMKAISCGEQDYSTFILDYEILKYALNPNTSSPEIINYLCDIEFFRPGAQKVFLLTDDLISILYENHEFERIENILNLLTEYNVWAEQDYNQSLHGSWYIGKSISENKVYFHNNDSYLRAYLYPIDKALKLALDNVDFTWIEKFNEYNSNLSKQFPELKLRCFTEKEIKIMKMEYDPKATAVDFLKLQCLNGQFFKLSESILCEERDIDFCKAKLIDIPLIEKDFISQYYISPLEMMLSCLEKKDYKTLFEFATDIQYIELQDAVANADDVTIKELFNGLFLPNTNYIAKIDKYENTLKNKYSSSNDGVTLEAIKKEVDKYIERLTNDLIQENEMRFRKKVNDNYIDYLSLQFANIPMSHTYDNFSIECAKKVKKDYVSKCRKYYEDLIEEIAHEKALKQEYEKITNQLSKDYLINEIKRGECDKAIVLLCKRLQIILEYKFKYKGDLFTMIDYLIKDHFKYHEMINPHDDEDNNYRVYLETDRINEEDNRRIERQIKLLHTLRMKRNNILHPEIKEVEITENEVLECIDLIEFLSK